MAKKKRGGDGANWLDTYADVVTLLLTFFVMLHASSSVDEEKWQYILEAFESRGQYLNTIIGREPDKSDSSSLDGDYDIDEPVGEYPKTFDQLYHYLVTYVEDNGLSESVEIERGPANVYLKFRDHIFFAGDSAVLLPEGKKVLSELSKGVNNVMDEVLQIRVGGHTAEFDSAVKDSNLSSGRAVNVVNYMTDVDKLDKNKFVAIGYGNTRPVDTNDTEAGRRRNRRVEIILVRKNADYSDPAVLEELLKMEYDYVSPDIVDGIAPNDSSLADDSSRNDDE